MFVVEHLVLGLGIGLGIFALTGIRNAVPVSLAATVLPDLIDKLIGWGIFRELYHNGRIYCHTLLLVDLLLALAAALLILRYWEPFVLAYTAALAVLVHQLADKMWLRPREWLWPLLGAMPRHGDRPGYLLTRIVTDVTTPSEWVLGAVVIAVLFLFWWLGPGTRSG